LLLEAAQARATRPRSVPGAWDRSHRAEAAPDFDEFLILRFKAANEPPYAFDWDNYNETRLDYAAALSRISARYQQRF
jgi:hypothetical protein